MYSSLVVSAALLRIFGQKVAELPMVATSREYQGRVSFLFYTCHCFSAESDSLLLYPFSFNNETALDMVLCRATFKCCLLALRIFFRR